MMPKWRLWLQAGHRSLLARTRLGPPGVFGPRQLNARSAAARARHSHGFRMCPQQPIVDVPLGQQQLHVERGSAVKVNFSGKGPRRESFFVTQSGLLDASRVFHAIMGLRRVQPVQSVAFVATHIVRTRVLVHHTTVLRGSPEESLYRHNTQLASHGDVNLLRLEWNRRA